MAKGGLWSPYKHTGVQHFCCFPLASQLQDTLQRTSGQPALARREMEKEG